MGPYIVHPLISIQDNLGENTLTWQVDTLTHPLTDACTQIISLEFERRQGIAVNPGSNNVMIYSSEKIVCITYLLHAKKSIIIN